MDEYNFVPMLYKGEETGYQACTLKGSVYITVDALEEFGDCSAIGIDRENRKILFELGSMNLLLGDEETTDFIREYGGTCYLSMKNIYDTLYVSLNMLKDFTGLSYETDGSTGLTNSDYQDTTYVDIDRTRETRTTGKITEKCKGAGSLFSPSDDVVNLKKNQKVYILGESFSFYKIQTFNGQICWVLKDLVEETESEAPEYDFAYYATPKKRFEGKINQVWTSPNSNGVSSLAPMPTGIDVVSPVWLAQQVDGNGDITNFGDRGYVDLCHERGMQVWITLNNSMTTKGSTLYTAQVLADENLRRKTIAQYLFYAIIHDADGLNIDYEDVRTADGDNLTLFIKEMYYYSDRLGLDLSSDVYVYTPGNYNIYQYDKVAPYLDHLCVMSYDEHYNGSEIAGSVSSKPFYTSAIETIAELCPAEKIMMGVPFYTRVWTVDENDRNLGVSAVIMSNARDKVNKAKAEPEWDEEGGQYVVTYDDGGKRIKIWLEDSRSIAQRLGFALEADLAGTCCWRYGQQEDGIMDIFEAIYKDGEDPDSFDAPY